MSSHQFRTRTATSLLIAALALVGVRGAAAAGVDLLGSSLGAGVGGVGQCSSKGIDVGYQVGYAKSVGGFAVTSVSLTGIALECLGRHVAVALTGADGAPLTSASSHVTGAETSVSFPEGAAVAAELVGSVSVVITD